MMPWTQRALILLLLGGSHLAVAKPEKEDPSFRTHRWQDRLIVLVAANGYQKSAWLHQQQESLLKGGPDMYERHVMIYMCRDTVCLRGAWVGDGKDHKWHPTSMLTAEVRKTWQIEQDTVLLIGKDGEEKGRWTHRFDPSVIKSLIDSMPMRQQEAGQKSGEGS